MSLDFKWAAIDRREGTAASPAEVEGEGEREGAEERIVKVVVVVLAAAVEKEAAAGAAGFPSRLGREGPSSRR